MESFFVDLYFFARATKYFKLEAFNSLLSNWFSIQSIRYFELQISIVWIFLLLLLFLLMMLLLEVLLREFRSFKKKKSFETVIFNGMSSFCQCFCKLVSSFRLYVCLQYFCFVCVRFFFVGFVYSRLDLHGERSLNYY